MAVVADESHFYEGISSDGDLHQLNFGYKLNHWFSVRAAATAVAVNDRRKNSPLTPGIARMSPF